ncbi:unnamed protein product [Prunus armeniaca]|uniref:Uncharacterized protein n=1 Tax=Prunus armeniaca TaxID=36596 RepID=A0A6J5X379_PRUAR|nr:unnamed protein product [Prunus armeniaca]
MTFVWPYIYRRPCPQLAHMDLIGFDNDKPPNYLLHKSGTNGTTAQLGEAIKWFPCDRLKL